MEEKKTNYDKTREDAEQRFLAYDQEKMIRKFSLKADENYLYLRFVGRDYRISRKNGRIEWNREEIGKDYFEPAQAGFEETLAIMDVLCSSKDDCQLAGTYNTIDRMKSVRYAATPGSGLYTTYEKLFDENTEKLQKVLENLGGTKDHPGDAAAKLPVFDFLPVIFQFWHSDEEFPATLKFMWDENTLDYLRFETAFYVMGHILSRIKEELVRLDTRRCTIETEGFGTMVFELYPEYAPITVESFKKLSDEGFYDGLCWCRIVKDYVIQGGSRTNDIMAECDWHIKGEFLENGVDNPLKHVRGAISMARDDAYDTADTQFFVVHKDAAKLDGRYAAFGEMLSGFFVLDKIADEPTYGPETWNKPVKMPVIRKITVE